RTHWFAPCCPSSNGVARSIRFPAVIRMAASDFSNSTNCGALTAVVPASHTSRMDIRRTRRLTILTSVLAACLAADSPKTLKVLSIGNIFTGRHTLSEVVKRMAEAGNPGLRFEVTTVIYGGRRLVDHWQLGTQNFVKLSSLTRADEEATIRSLEAWPKDDPL